MEFQKSNYWALILGGSTGLGLATAKKLARHGMNIIIVHQDDENQSEIQEAFADIRAHKVKLRTFDIDATEKRFQQKLIQEIIRVLGQDKIRTLVHSISKAQLKPLSGEEPTLQKDDFLMTIDAMAVSLYDWVKLCYNHKIFAKDARIISFTSEGNQKAWANYAAVSAAKVALEAITRSIALEFAPYGIRANCIQAGVTVTRSLQMIPGNETLRVHALKHNPFKRLTVPDDVANVVYLLSKDEACWITGSIIPVNGGEHLK